MVSERKKDYGFIVAIGAAFAVVIRRHMGLSTFMAISVDDPKFFARPERSFSPQVPIEEICFIKAGII